MKTLLLSILIVLMKYLLQFILCLSFSTQTFAQSKGFLYHVGESLLNLAGFSYTELSEKIYSNEVKATQCSHELMKFELLLGPRKSDAKDCQMIGQRKLEIIEDTGFEIYDFLRAGCKGKIELEAWRDTTNFIGPPSIKLITTFETVADRSGIVFLDTKRIKGPDRDPWKQYEARIQDINMAADQNRTLELNKYYDSTKTDLNGKENFGDVFFKYKIFEGSNKKINVEYSYNISNQRAAKYRTKQKFSFQCESKTLEEMNKRAAI